VSLCSIPPALKSSRLLRLAFHPATTTVSQVYRWIGKEDLVLRQRAARHRSSACPAIVWVFLQMLERERATSLFGLKRRNHFLKDTFSKTLI
jgi:hypothetical protein